MVLIVVERHWSDPQQFAEVQAREDAHAWCLELHRVRFVLSWFSLDRRRMVCLYEAPDLESVKRTNEVAGLPFDRVWHAGAELWPPRS